MKLLYLSSFIFLLLVSTKASADAIDNVANLIKQGNAKEIAKLFAPNVDITLMEDENTYPREKAATILEDFFAKNKPQSIKLLHKVNSSSSITLGVYILTTTDKKEYRIAFTLKNINGSMSIVEFRIEDEKVK
ncbi:DUF4783 domain-containing protein [Mucilaginibacter flavus]|uniref:DUF4783 domain-containing protein n=1 Tax=Mucilaginibacter flavus TaxID=931504 RepID=UPI0025B49800|nr:DUF4783 domain-containing protein [Mucilaginibacter flavus]MDN3581157.1 DUF4783 domain-containing protein [Mucilaginibacter flavus]